MWTKLPTSLRGATACQRSLGRRAQDGYTLVALLALMTVLALFALAAAPNIRQQAQREREIEAIFRGEEVADAIRDYYKYRVGQGQRLDQALPTSIEQLLEGVSVPGGTKKRQILRASATHDPLSASGEWRFIRPHSQGLIDFQRALILYINNIPPTPQDSQMRELQQFTVPVITSIVDSGSTASMPAAADDPSADSSGPFIGVASRNRNNSVLHYYGIDRHEDWIFTPLFR
jgi:type II secretory pathway pseudopilin PulG